MSINAIGSTGEPGGVSVASLVRQLARDAAVSNVDQTVEQLARSAQDQSQNAEQQRVQAGTTLQGIQQAGVREQILASQDIHASQEVLVAQVVRAGVGVESTRTVRRERKIAAVPASPAEEATAEHGEPAVLGVITHPGHHDVPAQDEEDADQVTDDSDAEPTVDVLL
jgi:hypothetical protein